MPDAPVIQPIVCPQCGGEFYPLSNAAHSHTICPLCASHVRVGDCVPAGRPNLEIQPWQTADDQLDQELVQNHAKLHRLILVASLVVVVIGGTILWKFIPRSGKLSVTSQPASEDHSKAELKQAYEIAKLALESNDWQGMLLNVSESDRMRPFMDWFYTKAKGGYVPRSLRGYDQGKLDLQASPPTATMRLDSADGPVYVIMKQHPEGWKLDWETYSNVHFHQWEYFLNQDPSLPKIAEFPFTVERMQPSAMVESFFSLSGFSPNDASRGIRLYVMSPRRAAAVCFSEDSAIGKELIAAADAATPTNPARYTLQVSLKSSDSFPQAVEVKKIVRKGDR